MKVEQQTQWKESRGKRRRKPLAVANQTLTLLARHTNHHNRRRLGDSIPQTTTDFCGVKGELDSRIHNPRSENGDSGSTIFCSATVVGYAHLPPPDGQVQGHPPLSHNSIRRRSGLSNTAGVVCLCSARCMPVFFVGVSVAAADLASEIQPQPAVVNCPLHRGTDAGVHNTASQVASKKDAAPDIRGQLDKPCKYWLGWHCGGGNGRIQEGCRGHPLPAAARHRIHTSSRRRIPHGVVALSICLWSLSRVLDPGISLSKAAVRLWPSEAECWE